jgi:transposase-like protein
LDSCEGKPVIVADRGLWYRWALDRLGNNLLPRGEEVIPT